MCKKSWLRRRLIGHVFIVPATREALDAYAHVGIVVLARLQQAGAGPGAQAAGAAGGQPGADAAPDGTARARGARGPQAGADRERARLAISTRSEEHQSEL